MPRIRTESSRLRDPVVEKRFPTLAKGDDLVFVPLGYESGYAYPLLVWLDDPTSKPLDLGHAMSKVSLRNYLAVQPSACSSGRLPLDPEESVWKAIDDISVQYNVNAKRIYLVGRGAGGTHAFRIACRHPRTVAGVVSLTGPFPLAESLFARLDEVRRLPMLMCCHRDECEAVNNRTDQTLRLFHSAGATLAMRIYPGSNPLSKIILNDVNRWLMDDICGSPVLPKHSIAR